MKIAVSELELWNQKLQKFQHSWFHTAEAAAIFAGFYKKDAFLFWEEKEDYQYLAPVVANSESTHLDYISTYGYGGAIFQGNIKKALTCFESRLNADSAVSAYVTLHPYFSVAESYTSSSFFRRNSSYLLDLRKTPKELHTGLQGRKRSQVKLKNDALVIRDKEKLIKPFVRLYKESMDRLGADPLYCFDPETLIAICNLKNTCLLGVQVTDEICAVTLSGWTSHTADFILSGSTEDGRGFSSLLLWESALHLKALDIPSYHLGGGMADGDGLDRFKALFGGQKCDYGAIKLVGDQETYASLCRDSGKDPEDRSGFFPAYRSPK